MLRPMKLDWNYQTEVTTRRSHGMSTAVWELWRFPEIADACLWQQAGRSPRMENSEGEIQERCWGRKRCGGESREGAPGDDSGEQGVLHQRMSFLIAPFLPWTRGHGGKRG